MEKVLDAQAAPPANSPPPLLALIKATRDELRQMQTRCGQLADLCDGAIARLENPEKASATSDPPLTLRLDLVAR